MIVVFSIEINLIEVRFITTNWCGERRLGTMGTTKFKVEKFMDSNDFGLWRLKMRALLVHQGLKEALKGI